MRPRHRPGPLRFCTSTAEMRHDEDGRLRHRTGAVGAAGWQIIAKSGPRYKRACCRIGSDIPQRGRIQADLFVIARNFNVARFHPVRTNVTGGTPNFRSLRHYEWQQEHVHPVDITSDGLPRLAIHMFRIVAASARRTLKRVGVDDAPPVVRPVPMETEGIMRRMLLGIALAFASLAASAGPAGAPVTVQNTPLPTTITNSEPLSVNIVQDPNNAQHTPLGVFIANEKVIGLEAVSAATTLGGIECAASVADGENGVSCLDGYGPRQLTAPFFLQMVTFMPVSYRDHPDVDFEGVRCQAHAHISLNDGASSTRVAAISWSPRTAVTSHVRLPASVILPPGSALRGRVRVYAENGALEDGCRVTVLFWSSTQ